ncbi:hypothetical protein DLAC_03280 [Tieghemostelium lacteum]|uniref:Uncharacterized protein n=1 Tax=Tieghemostelium lacteum TaxID=361077 RepID=A0A152A1K5_TIELA|nr:hypothetical protein DLAC_03280 [Tieghemostelium lacteum]|eukprot:KYR00128.1 hypothetical protein DLAC_03280 [Tieghemostelium lacteum]
MEPLVYSKQKEFYQNFINKPYFKYETEPILDSFKVNRENRNIWIEVFIENISKFPVDKGATYFFKLANLTAAEFREYILKLMNSSNEHIHLFLIFLVEHSIHLPIYVQKSFIPFLIIKNALCHPSEKVFLDAIRVLAYSRELFASLLESQVLTIIELSFKRYIKDIKLTDTFIENMCNLTSISPKGDQIIFQHSSDYCIKYQSELKKFPTWLEAIYRGVKMDLLDNNSSDIKDYLVFLPVCKAYLPNLMEVNDDNLCVLELISETLQDNIDPLIYKSLMDFYPKESSESLGKMLNIFRVDSPVIISFVQSNLFLEYIGVSVQDYKNIILRYSKYLSQSQFEYIYKETIGVDGNQHFINSLVQGHSEKMGPFAIEFLYVHSVNYILKNQFYKILGAVALVVKSCLKGDEIEKYGNLIQEFLAKSSGNISNSLAQEASSLLDIYIILGREFHEILKFILLIINRNDSEVNVAIRIIKELPDIYRAHQKDFEMIVPKLEMKMKLTPDVCDLFVAFGKEALISNHFNRCLLSKMLIRALSYQGGIDEHDVLDTLKVYPLLHSGKELDTYTSVILSNAFLYNLEKAENLGKPINSLLPHFTKQLVGYFKSLSGAEEEVKDIFIRLLQNQCADIPVYDDTNVALQNLSKYTIRKINFVPNDYLERDSINNYTSLQYPVLLRTGLELGYGMLACDYLIIDDIYNNLSLLFNFPELAVTSTAIKAQKSRLIDKEIQLEIKATKCEVLYPLLDETPEELEVLFAARHEISEDYIIIRILEYALENNSFENSDIFNLGLVSKKFKSLVSKCISRPEVNIGKLFFDFSMKEPDQLSNLLCHGVPNISYSDLSLISKEHIPNIQKLIIDQKTSYGIQFSSSLTHVDILSQYFMPVYTQVLPPISNTIQHVSVSFSADNLDEIRYNLVFENQIDKSYEFFISYFSSMKRGECQLKSITFIFHCSFNNTAAFISEIRKLFRIGSTDEYWVDFQVKYVDFNFEFHNVEMLPQLLPQFNHFDIAFKDGSLEYFRYNTSIETFVMAPMSETIIDLSPLFTMKNLKHLKIEASYHNILKIIENYGKSIQSLPKLANITLGISVFKEPITIPIQDVLSGLYFKQLVSKLLSFCASCPSVKEVLLCNQLNPSIPILEDFSLVDTYKFTNINNIKFRVLQ